jgi:lipoprotein NlpD
MKRLSTLLVLLFLPAFLLACSSALNWAPEEPEAPETYTVRQGDTLYSIAFRHGLDYRELAGWNNIGDTYLIYPGQTLELRPGSVRRAERRTDSIAGNGRAGGAPRGERQDAGRATRPPVRRDIDWAWPLRGEVLARFGDGAMGKGIQIGAEEGAAVYAAASGRVVYTGSGLVGYGKLIIIKHDDVYLSAYGHNREVLVSEGDEIGKGDRIALVGRGRGDRPMLHFEIRSEGNAVDPLRYLPSRG